MDFKKIGLMQSINESIKSKFKKNRTTCDGVSISYGVDAFNVIDSSLKNKKSSAIIKLSHCQAVLVFEYLRGKKFSRKLMIPDDIRVAATIGVITQVSLKHIATELLKSIVNADVICFEKMGKEEYLLVKSFINPKAKFVVLNHNECSLIENTSLLSYLKGKKVLVISPYDEIIKVQHLHQNLFHKSLITEDYSFDVLTLSLDTIYEKNSAYSLFDKLDSLKVEILKYDFDLALINLSILSAQVGTFVKSLDKCAIDLDEELLRVFGIAKDSAEKSKHDAHWIDLSSYNSGKEKSFLVTGVIGAPIKVKKGKSRKK